MTIELNTVGDICSILSLLISVISLLIVTKLYFKFSIRNKEIIEQKIKGDDNKQSIKK
jgi:hypothetical protein